MKQRSHRKVRVSDSLLLVQLYCSEDQYAFKRHGVLWSMWNGSGPKS